MQRNDDLQQQLETAERNASASVASAADRSEAQMVHRIAHVRPLDYPGTTVQQTRTSYLHPGDTWIAPYRVEVLARHPSPREEIVTKHSAAVRMDTKVLRELRAPASVPSEGIEPDLSPRGTRAVDRPVSH